MADAGALRAGGATRWPSYARPLQVDCVVAAEARGFLLGPALALELGAGFVLARKPGQAAVSRRSARSTCSSTAPASSSCTPTRCDSGARVLVHDDLLATGGTARALCELVEQLGGEVVGCGFLIELAFLQRPRAAGRARGARAARLRGLRAECILATRCPPRVRSRTIAAPAERAVGARRRPAPPAALVAARERVEDVDGGAFTEVMRTAKGKTVRADFHARATDRAGRARVRWEQRLEGTPFARRAGAPRRPSCALRRARSRERRPR